MQGCNYRRCNASGPHNEGPNIATFYCKIFSLKAQVNLLLLNVILELLVASQQFSRRSPIKRDLPPASKYNRKIFEQIFLLYFDAGGRSLLIGDRLENCWLATSNSCINDKS